jgi:hypothetical protein
MKRVLFIIWMSMLLILVAGYSCPLRAQPQYFNYNTGGTGNSFPFNVAGGKRVQVLYRPGDFNQPTPATAGSITSISFFMTGAFGSGSYTDLTIKLGQSTITSFTAGSFYAGVLTTVYYRAVGILTGAAGQWMTLTLDTPFPYDPTQSLIVDISQCGVVGATGGNLTIAILTGNRRIWSATESGCPLPYVSTDSEVYYMGITLGSRLIIGDTVSVGGSLTVPKVSYTSPREHVTSVSSEAFFPTAAVPYFNSPAQGGAFLPADAGGAMAAAVQLPDGATVTKFRVYFYDNSPKDLDISLDYQALMVGSYGTMAEVTTSGAQDAYTYLETTSISQPVIDNVNKGYLIWVWPVSTWDDSNLRVKGVSIYYTLAEAP